MTDSTNFKDFSKAPSLPLFSKRPDVRLYHNLLWPPFPRNSGADEAIMLNRICKRENDCVMNEQDNNRTKFLHLRLKPAEYEKILRQFSKTTCRKLSDYARKILLGKPMIATTRDQSLDDFMAEAIRLRNDLNNVGNNINQAVKKLHTLDQIEEFRTWIMTYEIEKKILFNKIDDIKNHIKKIGERWLK